MDAITRTNLRFVDRGFPHTQWGIGKIGDNLVTLITTRLYATNASSIGSIVPVRLMKIHLLRPSQKSLVHSDLVTVSDEYANSLMESVIPEGHTRELIIDCSLSKVFKPGKGIKVRFAVEDQLAYRHVMRPLVVLPGPSAK